MELVCWRKKNSRFLAFDAHSRTGQQPGQTMDEVEFDWRCLEAVVHMEFTERRTGVSAHTVAAIVADPQLSLRPRNIVWMTW